MLICLFKNDKKIVEIRPSYGRLVPVSDNPKNMGCHKPANIWVAQKVKYLSFLNCGWNYCLQQADIMHM